MTRAFESAKVELSGGHVHVQCRVLNPSGESWRHTDGWAVGYHLFDDPTGTLVIDGERTPLDLAPSQSCEIALSIKAPRDPGIYRIYVSVMREDVAWFYEQGWPFVLIEVTVDDSGAAKLGRWQIATRGHVMRRRLIRGIGRSFTLPGISLWRNRGLIRTLVKRDVMSRYSGSFGGAFWAVLNPLLLMVTYFFVFGLVLKSRFGNDPSRTGFALYFLAGMLPWLAFSEAVGRAPFTLVEHRNFIKKLVFPVETLPVNLVAAGLVTEFFGLILFAVALLLTRGYLPWTLIYLPLLIIPQVLFTAGVSWFLAALAVFVRDLAQVIGFILTLWFFITPICYPETSLPAEAAGLLQLNPLFILVRGYRAVFLESHAPDFTAVGWLTLVSAVFFFAGHAWFYKLRKSFADIV